jgi:hypothetical protein
MYSINRWIALGSAAALAVACRPPVEVRTIAAPDVELTSFHSFRMLPAPARRDRQPMTEGDDPMISNSIANRALQDQIVKAFQGRGYVRDDRHADIAVAFYATAHEKLDVSTWDYGYPFNPRWPGYPPPTTVTPYTEGTVVIDVVRSESRELLWRGEGKAELSDDAAENVRRLARVADGIVARFPRPAARVVANAR